MFPTLKPKQMKEKVKVICYNKEKTMTRKEALDLYYEGMLCCDGCEAERYQNIVCQLLEGAMVARDDIY